MYGLSCHFVVFEYLGLFSSIGLVFLGFKNMVTISTDVFWWIRNLLQSSSRCLCSDQLAKCLYCLMPFHSVSLIKPQTALTGEIFRGSCQLWLIYFEMIFFLTDSSKWNRKENGGGQRRCESEFPRQRNNKEKAEQSWSIGLEVDVTMKKENYKIRYFIHPARGRIWSPCRLK